MGLAVSEGGGELVLSVRDAGGAIAAPTMYKHINAITYEIKVISQGLLVRFLLNNLLIKGSASQLNNSS